MWNDKKSNNSKMHKEKEFFHTKYSIFLVIALHPLNTHLSAHIYACVHTHAEALSIQLLFSSKNAFGLFFPNQHL